MCNVHVHVHCTYQTCTCMYVNQTLYVNTKYSKTSNLKKVGFSEIRSHIHMYVHIHMYTYLYLKSNSGKRVRPVIRSPDSGYDECRYLGQVSLSNVNPVSETGMTGLWLFIRQCRSTVRVI